MPVGDRLRELRIRKGDSLQQVAYAIGASKAHIWELENNKSKNPSLDLLNKLAQHFDTKVAYIIDEAQYTSSTEDFIQRNSQKLAMLDDDELSLVEQFIDLLARRSRRD